MGAFRPSLSIAATPGRVQSWPSLAGRPLLWDAWTAGAPPPSGTGSDRPSDGAACAVWAGEQVLQARAVNHDTDELIAANLTAIADPGPAFAVTVTPGEHTVRIGEEVDLATSSVRVADEYGNQITDPPPLQFRADAPLTIDGTRVSSAEEVAGQVTSGTGNGAVSVKVLRDLLDSTAPREASPARVAWRPPSSPGGSLWMSCSSAVA
jgi:hypothetical protein